MNHNHLEPNQSELMDHSMHHMAGMEHDKNAKHDTQDSYNKYAGHSLENFKKKFYIVVISNKYAMMSK